MVLHDHNCCCRFHHTREAKGFGGGSGFKDYLWMSLTQTRWLNCCMGLGMSMGITGTLTSCSTFIPEFAQNHYNLSCESM